MEVEALRKERDEAIKKVEELARLVEEQEEDFAHKTRKIQWQVEMSMPALENFFKDMIMLKCKFDTLEFS
ncbi:hypothetical protein QYF36_010478 [Acer negundo]|nr:hypothetical protein QYF36_010478 [Acer negundo]